METMAQELNINNHNLRSIQKLFCECGKSNVFYNAHFVDIKTQKIKYI